MPPKVQRKKFTKRRGRARKSLFSTRKTNSLYHNSVPRTLQIATQRDKSVVLKFISNQTYYLHPQYRTDAANTQPENMFLRFRANSIIDIMNSNNGNGSITYQNANTWQSQDPANYGPSQSTINALGVADWEQRYSHFTVLGSRIQATCQAVKASIVTTKEVPGTFYINLSGAPVDKNPIDRNSQPADIMELPYTVRARIIAAAGNNTFSTSTSVPGARLSMNYSTKRFEGVSDVMDNATLRGQFDNAETTGGQLSPAEQSMFTLGFIPTMPYFGAVAPGSGDPPVPPGSPPSGLLQDQLVTIKMEYIVKLTEPSSTNQPTQRSVENHFIL